MTRRLYQTDAYLESIRTKVTSCEQLDEGFELILEETILYPEGGGQPSDHGTVEGQRVKRLSTRDDGAVVHHVDESLQGTVTVELAWPRRYDHMQQHTGQHLLTAAAFDLFGLNTTAFHLGENRCDIELDCPDLSMDRMEAIQERVNHQIRAGLAVSARFVDSSRLDRERVRSRGLPEGFEGEVRLVEIEGVDINTCGGTHVANTSELQVVKLLHTECLRGGTRLFFIVGIRVLNLFQEMFSREQALTKALSCGPDEHGAGVDRLLADVKSGERVHRSLMKELAKYAGEDLARQGKVVSYHRSEGDIQFLKAVAAAARKQRPDIMALLTTGESSGVFLLIGPEAKVETLKESVAELMGGRGGGKGGDYQGKASRLDRRTEAMNLLRA